MRLSLLRNYVVGVCGHIASNCFPNVSSYKYCTCEFNNSIISINVHFKNDSTFNQ